MTTLESRNSQRGRAAVVALLVLVAIIAALAAGAWHFRQRLESEPPQITVSTQADVIGTAPFEVDVADAGAGLKSVTATISQGGAEHTLASEQYARPVPGKKIAVALAKVPGIKEGPATLKVTASDASLWHWGAGNAATLEKKLTVDITPPTLELIADDPYINFGGVGLIAYKTSSDAVTSGVKIGNYFFPGYKGQTSRPTPITYISFFAHPYNVSEDKKRGPGGHRQGRQLYASCGLLIPPQGCQIQKKHHSCVRRFHP